MTDYSDDYLREILQNTKTIAMVGASLNPARPSYRVGEFLAECGYQVIPVNPGHVGETLFGEKIVGALSDISEPVDMVDIFRRSEHVGPIVEAALAMTGLQSIWMQIGVENAEAAKAATAAGVKTVMNRCPKIEYPRLIQGS